MPLHYSGIAPHSFVEWRLLVVLEQRAWLRGGQHALGVVAIPEESLLQSQPNFSPTCCLTRKS